MEKNVKFYRLLVNGNSMGVYFATCAGSVIAQYVLDAGYANIGEAADACGQCTEDFLSDIDVEVILS